MNKLQKFGKINFIKIDKIFYELISGAEDSLVLTLPSSSQTRFHVYYARHCPQDVLDDMDKYSDDTLTVYVQKQFDIQKVIYRIPGEGLFYKSDVNDLHVKEIPLVYG